jgi:hypothetical protein
MDACITYLYCVSADVTAYTVTAVHVLVLRSCLRAVCHANYSSLYTAHMPAVYEHVLCVSRQQQRKQQHGEQQV